MLLAKQVLGRVYESMAAFRRVSASASEDGDGNPFRTVSKLAGEDLPPAGGAGKRFSTRYSAGAVRCV